MKGVSQQPGPAKGPTVTNFCDSGLPQLCWKSLPLPLLIVTCDRKELFQFTSQCEQGQF